MWVGRSDLEVCPKVVSPDSNRRVGGGVRVGILPSSHLVP